MKKKDDLPHLAFLDKEGNTLHTCKLTSVPLREDAVLGLSVEFFCDPEPCMIHRSAVMSRMYMELLEYFQQEQGRGHSAIPLAQLPQRLASFFNIDSCEEIHVIFSSSKL